MKTRGFRRFVAVFVGIVLVAAAVMAVVTEDEKFIVTALLVAALYAFYMIQFVRLEKEYKEKQPKQTKSPLMRR